MPKTITILWYGTTPQIFNNVDEFSRVGERGIQFKTVEKNGDKTLTRYIKTDFPYFFEEVIEHSGAISI